MKISEHVTKPVTPFRTDSLHNPRLGEETDLLQVASWPLAVYGREDTTGVVVHNMLYAWALRKLRC